MPTKKSNYTDLLSNALTIILCHIQAKSMLTPTFKWTISTIQKVTSFSDISVLQK